ncbi:N-acetylmuramoyl-L-alanine amidase [Poseidonocella sedimentorum]|uniref:N-acetylmuramoyl-L-alanine amidase n=1 Tax=Poseidonocella sedimentorum TaxID=871652 RepID=A0A1I6CWE9_9RHOB|nr:N-acetylmuramoyl-L-alanine amidase [Poseidonocella sedimentorum]SFQ97544.1 N-acetylmuramoyl-L-alanine amidase [Poseidonocella sedimentorum]
MYSIRDLADGDFLYLDGGRVEHMASPHNSGNFRRKPRFLVMHYTAGSSGRSSASWFTNPAAKASAHLTIERDGSVIQSVPFTKRAWHAGRSAWRARDGARIDGLNHHSIGIELANAGACVRTASGAWTNPLGVRVSPDNIAEARHKNGAVWLHGSGNVSNPGWEIYPRDQLVAAIEIAKLLIEQYDLEDVIGHDDISPGRKTDPGPLFDMNSFRGTVFGRGEDGDLLWEVRAGTPGGLAIRTGPGKANAKAREENLAVGTKVQFNEAEGRWWFVTVLDADGGAELDGWVYSGYLVAV